MCDLRQKHFLVGVALAANISVMGDMRFGGNCGQRTNSEGGSNFLKGEGNAMKKLSIMWGVVLFIHLMSNHSHAETYFNYHTDLLEQGNIGGWPYSLKTFDDEYTVTVGKTSKIDVWVHDVVLDDDGILYADLGIEYNPVEVEICGVEVFDGVNGPPGPWDPEMTDIIVDVPFNPGACQITTVNANCVLPDNDGDVIIARIIVKSLSRLRYGHYRCPPTNNGADHGQL